MRGEADNLPAIGTAEVFSSAPEKQGGCTIVWVPGKQSLAELAAEDKIRLLVSCQGRLIEICKTSNLGGDHIETVLVAARGGCICRCGRCHHIGCPSISALAQCPETSDGLTRQRSRPQCNHLPGNRNGPRIRRCWRRRVRGEKGGVHWGLLQANDLINQRRVMAALHLHEVQLSAEEARAGGQQIKSGAGADHLHAIELAQALGTASEIHRVPHATELEPLPAPDVACKNLTCVDPDPNSHVGQPYGTELLV
mmetsp:Transcript_36897/g.97238  ORF Transcript_36897/g.97238 Transcript_36897/m.97238 type:complete len:253 (-) Transcript_36897:147-905(-)